MHKGISQKVSRYKSTIITLYSQLHEYVSFKRRYDSYLCCVSFRTPNWGDALNRELIEAITGIPVHIIHAFYLDRLSLFRRMYEGERKFTFVGSVMRYVPPCGTVWGSGSVWYEDVPRYDNIHILAVRGPLTRKVLLKYGYKCPSIYGDPVLLIGHVFPQIHSCCEKKYNIGIIPHLFEKDLPVTHLLAKQDGVTKIDITLNFVDFINRVRECEYIASSSLHGLILSDVLKIPNLWIKYSDLIDGGDFKFLDYYATTDYYHDNLKPVLVHERTQIEDLIKYCCIKNTEVNLNELREVLIDHLKTKHYLS